MSLVLKPFVGIIQVCISIGTYDHVYTSTYHSPKYNWLAAWVWSQRTGYGLVQMTGTTDIEEELLGAGGMVPFSIEAKLRKYGAYFRQGTSDTRPFATRSGSIVTGQNCASTLLTAEGLVEAMSLGVRMTVV